MSAASVSLTKDTVFYSISTWGQAAITVFVLPVTIAYFSPHEYGYMILVNTVAMFLHLLGMLAVADQGLPRFFLNSDDAAERDEYVASTFFITAVSNLALIVIVFCSIPLLPGIFHEIHSPLLFAGLVSAAFLSQSFGVLGNALLRWTYQSPLFMRINIGKTALIGVLTLIGVTMLGWRANGIILITALCSFLAGIWAIHAVRRHINLNKVSLAKVKNLLAYSWPLLGLNIFAYFTVSLDRIFLAKWSTLHNVGIFSVASTVASLFAIATSGFFMATAPYFLSTYKEQWAPGKFAEYFSLLTVVGLISIIVLGLWGAPLVSLLKPQGEYHDIGQVIPLLAAGSVVYYLGTYFAPGPFIMNKTHLCLIAFVISTMVNSMTCYFLIPRYGIFGAGLAALFGSLSAAIFIQTISNRLYSVPNRWLTSFALAIFLAFVISIIQSPWFLYNINESSLTVRLVITVLFVMASIIPFYHDVLKSGVAHSFYKYMRGGRSNWL